MILDDFNRLELIHPPNWLPNNTQYLVIMGSMAYGTNTASSDFDVYGFAVPPLDQIFPHLSGYIPDFDAHEAPHFLQWQEHHIKKQDDEREYDFTVFGLIRYFKLVMDNNPNMIDSLFVPERCIMHKTAMAQMVRDNRKLFLSKKSWSTFRGYAHCMLHKAKSQERVGKRKETVERFGYDLKFASHVIRLMDEIEQLLETGDLDLERSKEIQKEIRRGEWSWQRVEDYFTDNEKRLQAVYDKSGLQYAVDAPKIKDLLLSCIEHHYGSLDKVVRHVGKEERILRDIAKMVEPYIS